MKTLDELGLQYGTDKASSFHDYLRRYEPFLRGIRESAQRVLEIGVYQGASLRMWRDYFPNAQIFGLDIDPQCAALDLGERIRVVIGDAKNPDTSLAFVDDFDLIIDDGDHYRIGLTFLDFWHLVAPFGFYIVEDLHAVYSPGVSKDPVYLFKSLIDTMNHHELNGGVQCASKNLSAFRSVHFAKGFIAIEKNGP